VYSGQPLLGFYCFLLAPGLKISSLMFRVTGVKVEIVAQRFPKVADFWGV
jgi:hypothetical protein